jgi:hypothetical protein
MLSCHLPAKKKTRTLKESTSVKECSKTTKEAEMEGNNEKDGNKVNL